MRALFYTPEYGINIAFFLCLFSGEYPDTTLHPIMKTGPFEARNTNTYEGGKIICQNPILTAF